MRAHMDQRIAARDFAQPQIERHVGVARRPARVVILGGAVESLTAIGLRRNQRVAAAHDLEDERAIDDRRVSVGLAPLRDEIGGERGVDLGQRGAIVIEWPAHRFGLQPVDQRGGIRRRIGYAIAVTLQQAQHCDGAGRGVEPDGVRDLVVAAGIGRQHQRDALVVVGGPP